MGGGGGLAVGVYRSELSLDLKPSRLSEPPGEERHLSVLCPAGRDGVAAGVVLSGAQSAA